MSKIDFQDGGCGGHLGFSFGSSILAVLCLLGALMLFVKFQLKWISMGKQIWTCRKKVKRQSRTIILAILVDLPSPMICVKIRPQGLFSSGEEDFWFLPYMGMAVSLVNGPRLF